MSDLSIKQATRTGHLRGAISVVIRRLSMGCYSRDEIAKYLEDTLLEDEVAATRIYGGGLTNED